MLAMASGRSANRRAISAADLRWRSELRASSRPAVVERDFVADAGEDVQHFALLRRTGVGGRRWWPPAECAGGGPAR